MRLAVSVGLREGGLVQAPLRAWVLELDSETGAIGRRLALPFDAELASGPDASDEAMRPVLLPQGVLLQPTHTQLFWVCMDSWSVIDRFSHPLMSSVHSACERPGGGFALSCAGNDSVLEFDGQDQLLAHHWLPGAGFDERYGEWVDFRRLHHDALKPHSHHPNCAFYVDGELWVSCFETRELRTVDGSRRVPLPGIPHDGGPQAGGLWLTLVDGRLEERDPKDGALRRRVDVRGLTGSDRMLGWCRGIGVHGSRAWVGMTQLRSTTHREVLRVLLRGERGRKLPSRVVEIDLDEARIVREIPIGNEAGATIYGITVLA